MAPAHKLLHGLPEVAKYLGYDPRRLALAERAGANQVGYEFLMRLYCARHHSRMADPVLECKILARYRARILYLARTTRAPAAGLCLRGG